MPVPGRNGFTSADRVRSPFGRSGVTPWLPCRPLQVYYSLWRRLLKIFWWLVVAYTMLVLISIYTYQFEDFPGYWRNFTGFTEEQ